ncbi:TonB-dependent receptor plug domain-containing protein [Erythrobacter crassostreae]|uniref:TonB-dependent receptor plug domain-containing protein n=1 Tax=Erythrobacter crassostreae TaxID=2828328 RepID=A0A9X1F3H9_9SPHN|nr:TonB-dependent receptor [Erythrobacter crassostrea]MBV7259621.1 TonB-dependent receptor plug domain-containing protein [Erythrobacter crassostrea]
MKYRSILISTAAAACIAAPLSAEDEVRVDTVGSEDSAAAAQEGSAETESARTRRVFAPADFERFAPRNALDMAQQIPGFSIQSDDGGRGLGQASTNVIINGQRISGKSNGPVEALRRIPVEEVVRLEIVDGASLDIGGLSGQVLNVVTKSTGGINGQFRYSAEWRSFGVPFRWGDGQISLAGGGEKTEWTLSFENDAGRRGNEGIEQVFDAADVLIDTRDEQSKFVSDRPSLSGSFARTANNGNILNLTGSIAANLFDRSETSVRTGTICPADRFRLFTSKEDEFNYEFGADYSFGLGGGTLKVIGYRRFEDSPTSSEVITTFADGSSPEGSLFVRDADEAETILRGEYGFGGLGGDIQFALEGVKNSLEIESALEVRDAAGVLQPEEFDGSSARVEEDRAEGSVTYGRALADSLQMQLSVGGEYSTISQSGPLGQTRSFFRPKGFAALDWKANEMLNLSGRVERVVGQLNFFDFIASTDLNQDRVNVTNADLVPPQSWLFELEATQSLGAYGSINLRGFYEDLSDFVDQIPIDGGGEAPGNIDAATIKGVEGEVTLLFDPVGVNGLRLDAEFRLADSEILDPLFGTPRDISGFRNFTIDVEMRKDFFGSDWAVGGAYRFSENRADVRLSEVSQREDAPGFARAFIEHKDVLGMTARFRVGNLINQNDNFSRTIFTDRLNGIVDSREERRRVFGVIYSFDIEGSF